MVDDDPSLPCAACVGLCPTGHCGLISDSPPLITVSHPCDFCDAPVAYWLREYDAPYGRSNDFSWALCVGCNRFFAGLPGYYTISDEILSQDIIIDLENPMM